MASDLTYALFVARFPGFQAPNDTDRQTEIQYALDDAELEVHRSTWGAAADKAVMLLCAHELTMKGRLDKHGGHGAGPVTARTTGQNVVGFGSIVAGGGHPDDVYKTTPHGVNYLRLRGTLDLTPFGIGESG